MEILIVYGLVLLFFVLLAMFVVAVLASHPYAEPPAAVEKSATAQKSSAARDNMIAYGVLGVIMAFLFVITLLSERERGHIPAS
jgi:hypothetical protein